VKLEISAIAKTATIRFSGKVDPVSRDSAFATYEFTTTLTAGVSLEGAKLADAEDKLHKAAYEATLRDLEHACEVNPAIAAIAANVEADLSKREIRDRNRAKQLEE
jgi:lipid-binding SYLF domain-containing protein